MPVIAAAYQIAVVGTQGAIDQGGRVYERLSRRSAGGDVPDLRLAAVPHGDGELTVGCEAGAGQAVWLLLDEHQFGGVPQRIGDPNPAGPFSLWFVGIQLQRAD